MANAYSLIWGESDVDVRMLCEKGIGPYAAGRAVDYDGPYILLSPDAISALGMAVHELATNAAKYGSLSALNGSVGIQWRVNTSAAEGSTFIFNWIETGGPESHEPIRRGFGLKAMEKLLAQEIEGKAKLTFTPEGVRCSIEAPFTEKVGAFSGSTNWSIGPAVNAIQF